MKKEEAYVELKVLDSKIKQVQKHLEKLDEQMGEANEVKNSVDSFSTIKPGTEMQIPLANGIFFRAELKDTDKVIVNVGSNVAVAKSLDDVKKMLDSQLEELNAYRVKLISELEKMIQRAEEIQKELKE